MSNTTDNEPGWKLGTTELGNVLAAAQIAYRAKCPFEIEPETMIRICNELCDARRASVAAPGIDARLNEIRKRLELKEAGPTWYSQQEHPLINAIIDARYLIIALERAERRAAAASSAPAELPPSDAKFVPTAEDALHIAICQAVQEHHGPSANAILRAALNDYKPTQLTRTELIRVQQRGGSGEVTAVMVSPLQPEGEQEREVQCADCLTWFKPDTNHTCRQQVRRNQRSAK